MADVLVIDDSPTAIAFATRTLAQYGHKVKGLKSFAELPKTIKEGVPALILLDLEMPAFAGPAFARFINRCVKPRPPILVYSALPQEEIAQTAQEIGASGFLRKGASGSELGKEVARLLAESAAVSAH
jgi:DNA-binding response OmpR family regulator